MDILQIWDNSEDFLIDHASLTNFGLKKYGKSYKKQIDYRQTDRQIDQPTDTVNYRVGYTRLKSAKKVIKDQQIDRQNDRHSARD